MLRPCRCVLPLHILYPGQVDMELWERELTLLNIFSGIYALQDGPSTGLHLGDVRPCAHQWFGLLSMKEFLHAR